MKIQISKLQRLRDQMKIWVASNDVKDKSALWDNRRLIETVSCYHPNLDALLVSSSRIDVEFERFTHLTCPQRMEKFKAYQKETKTNALSKNAKVQEKHEVTAWIQTQVEELLLQIEVLKAEVETLQDGTKNSKSGGAAAKRLEELKHMNERRKWHVSRLETIMRLLDNGSMAVEEVEALQEDVRYFVESNIVGGPPSFLFCVLLAYCSRMRTSKKMRASMMI
jgi:CCR4-NOT transcription complex subunit 3